MRKANLVHMGLPYALLAAVLVGGTVTGTPINTTAAFAMSESADGLPTVGGEPAFATRSDAMLSTVQSLIKAQDYEKARDAAVELTTTYPDHVQGWLLLGYCRSLTGDYDGSNEAYDSALSHGADSRTVLMRKAYNHIKKGDFANARTCYEEILEKNYTDQEVLKLVAVMEGKLGNHEEAARYYRRVLDVNPASVDAMLALARIAEKRERPAEMKELLEKALEIEPGNTKALNKLAKYRIDTKDYAGAVACLANVVALDPDNVKAYRNLGVSYYGLEDKKNARDAFEKVWKMGGEMCDLYGPLADCYRATAQKAEALEVIREGVARDCQKAWLYCLWGKSLEETKNFDAAIGKFRLAVQEDEEPWRGYALKEIARQQKHKQRAAMIAEQQGMQ